MTPLQPPHPAPHRPARITPPPGACDSHCHIFGPQTLFPYQAKRSYQPAEAPLERYEHLQRRLGLTRAVFVQPAVYGSDHSAICDAIARGNGRYRGVAVLPHDITASAIRALHTQGICGARYNFVGHLGVAPPFERVRRQADVIIQAGWHIDLHIDAAALERHADDIAALDCTLVIDHMARLLATPGGAPAALPSLLALAALPHVWIKLSAADRMVASEAQLAIAVPIMRAIADAAPDRVLWGSDWPHPNVRFMPDDGDIIDLLADAVPDEARRYAILVDNPARLFGFDHEARYEGRGHEAPALRPPSL